VGGVWGALATGLFASIGGTGLFYGNFNQLVVQLGSLGVTLVYTVVVTVVILKVIDSVIGLRVAQDEERQGLDLSQHGESAYN
jgi:Amt family ammonium transporter